MTNTARKCLQIPKPTVSNSRFFLYYPHCTHYNVVKSTHLLKKGPCSDIPYKYPYWYSISRDLPGNISASTSPKYVAQGTPQRNLTPFCLLAKQWGIQQRIRIRQYLQAKEIAWYFSFKIFDIISTADPMITSNPIISACFTAASKHST